ncbi:hypothetical protein XELAEV_18041750mg [Xenopus laevis]|uniref:P2X purinoreceptor 7 intracellular domain-containing protein n=1 Tax=Xenopus laevis TaxID=8355 RepID=A0A974C2R0_XENLA|nr:hypothetical protein XELAEV_18041750mg [Xenopus laevis]
MPTLKECICCCEIRNAFDIIEQGTNCIVESPFFINQCLNEDKVYFNLRLAKNMTRRPSDDDYLRYLRMMAYRTFTIWTHKFLGKRNRRPVPACVVKAIRTVCPDFFSLYRGFIPLDDYAAADMAFDLE